MAYEDPLLIILSTFLVPHSFMVNTAGAPFLARYFFSSLAL